MTDVETTQLAELVGGAKDGERLVIHPGSKRIHIPLGPSYRRTGERRTVSDGGVTVHYFEIEE